VTWVDGDSGYVNGREFRLHGVDAPESSPSRARCTKERELARASRSGAENATGGRRVTVARSYGTDAYGRELVDLRADRTDVASTLLKGGHVKRWNFEAGQAKPDWC
jgi:endonuclease YncB( thermonuclease family)